MRTAVAGQDDSTPLIQDVILVQRGDSRVTGLKRVGLFPGPRKGKVHSSTYKQGGLQRVTPGKWLYPLIPWDR